jgi:hypothetical protein
MHALCDSRARIEGLRPTKLTRATAADATTSDVTKNDVTKNDITKTDGTRMRV